MKLAYKPGINEKTSETIGYIQAVEEVKNMKCPEDTDKLVEVLNKYGRRNQQKEFTQQFDIPGMAGTRQGFEVPPPKKKKKKKKQFFGLSYSLLVSIALNFITSTASQLHSNGIISRRRHILSLPSLNEIY